MNRSKLREIIIKVLYQKYIYDSKNLDYNLENLIKEQLETKNDFVIDTVININKNQEKLNKIANKHMTNWNIERLSKVDKAIISLGIYELLYTDTPNIVAINEAIDLAKLYSDEKVVKMINGILDSIMHNEETNEW